MRMNLPIPLVTAWRHWSNFPILGIGGASSSPQVNSRVAESALCSRRSSFTFCTDSVGKQPPNDPISSFSCLYSHYSTSATNYNMLSLTHHTHIISQFTKQKPYWYRQSQIYLLTGHIPYWRLWVSVCFPAHSHSARNSVSRGCSVEIYSPLPSLRNQYLLLQLVCVYSYTMEKALGASF